MLRVSANSSIVWDIELLMSDRVWRVLLSVLEFWIGVVFDLEDASVVC